MMVIHLILFSQFCITPHLQLCLSKMFQIVYEAEHLFKIMNGYSYIHILIHYLIYEFGLHKLTFTSIFNGRMLLVFSV